MSLADLFSLKESLRGSVRRRRQAHVRSTPRFFLELLESRVLLSATPTEIPASPQVEPAAVTVSPGSQPNLDIDLNGQADALTDGILITRYLFGFTGNALVDGVVDPAGQRTDPNAIEAYLKSISPALDIDLNQRSDALTDGILIMHSLFGFTGQALTGGVIDTTGQRTDPTEIAAFLDNMNPQRELVAPVLAAGLQQDSGLSASDAITFDPTITGTITDINQIAAFTAGFDATPVESFVDVLADLQGSGTFTLTPARLAEIAGGALADGAHVLHLRATDARGNVSGLDYAFTLDTLAPTVSFSADVADVDPGTPGTQVVEGTVIPIQPAVSDNGSISNVDLFVNGQVVQSSGVFPFDLSVTASTATPGLTSSISEPGGRAYSTNFQQTENPISEGGLWLNGLTDGLDWLDIRTEGGVAYGTRVGGLGDVIDPTAILTGVWGQNQTVEAGVVVNVGGAAKEIELRLNSTLTAHSSTGYEILYEVVGTIAIVRWDGAIGNLVFLSDAQNLSRALVTGDVLKATNVDGVITAYFNGEQVAQVTDTTYTDGAPGMGLNNYGEATDPTDFGLSSFSASAPATGTALQVRAMDVAGNAALSDPFFLSVVPAAFVPVSAGSTLSGVAFAQTASGDGVAPALFLPSEVVQDSLGTAAGMTATPADLLTNLAGFRLDPQFQEFDGRGMTAVIIDTGVDVDHPFFGPDADHNGVADRIVFQWDFADNDADASDRVGHGTHIASLIGSEDATYPGVAPEADLIALKVFSDTGSGTFAFVEQALQWVVAHAAQYSIDVVNLSLGDGQNWATSGSHYGLGDEFAELANDGIVVVAAAGNNFFTARSQPGVSYPAADPNVIGVGAVWTQDFGGPWRWSSGAADLTTGADRIASFSQRDAMMTEIFAPGARLVGANQSGGTVTMQGTSQAAAYLSGTALLAQQMAREELGRKLTPQEFTELVGATGKKIVDGDDEQDNIVNTGLTFSRVDMLQLATAIERSEDQEGHEGGRHHHRDREYALAYTQRCWVRAFVSEETSIADDVREELSIVLPG